MEGQLFFVLNTDLKSFNGQTGTLNMSADDLGILRSEFVKNDNIC